MLWSDERILSEIPAMTAQNRCYPAILAVVGVMKKMREEYESRVVQLEQEIAARDGYIDDLGNELRHLSRPTTATGDIPF